MVPASATDKMWLTVTYVVLEELQNCESFNLQCLWSTCESSKEAGGRPSPLPLQGCTVGRFTLILGLILTC